jgi:putative transposase
MMVAEGHEASLCTRVLDVSRSGYYMALSRPPSTRSIRHAWLTDVITQVHLQSRGTYGAPRVHAELRMGQGVVVGHNVVARLMRQAGLAGAMRGPKRRYRHETPSIGDFVGRQFERHEPNQLWVTDITEHPTREGKVYCAVVLDVFSRRVVGWSIDASATASLTTNALGMAIESRRPDPGAPIHSDHGAQFTSWAFTSRSLASGLVPSMGSVGDCFDNAVIESFWSRVQVELLDRRRWKTRVELANALFEYLEVFHNHKRRHSSLGMRTPVEFEQNHLHPQAVA